MVSVKQNIFRSILRLTLLIFLPVAVLIVLILGSIFYHDHQNYIQNAKDAGGSDIQSHFNEVKEELSWIVQDMYFLQSVLGSLNYYDQPDDPAIMAEVEKNFLVFGQLRSCYDQIRILDLSGQEVFRINHRNGTAESIAREKLQDKSDRYYFTESARLDYNQIYISPLDLNVENGQVEIPFKPMIRFGMSFFDHAGNRKGVLVLNYKGDNLFETFHTDNTSDYVINKDGYLLFGPQEENLWGFMFNDHRRGYVLNNLLDKTGRAITQSEEGAINTTHGVFVWRTISPLAAIYQTLEKIDFEIDPDWVKSDQQWKFVYHISAEEIQAHHARSFHLLALLGLVFLSVSLLGAWFLARYIILRRITQLSLEKEKDRAEAIAVRADRASQAKSEFLAQMSHEIRTPMSGVLGMIELALDERLDEMVSDYLITAKDSATALLTIINDILDISKIEAGKVEIEQMEFDVQKLLSDIDNMMRSRIEDKGLKFEILLDGPIHKKIFNDPTRIRQCLINLLGNAVKFTEQGHIYLRVTTEKNEVGTMICFSVEDTGIGIPKDRQQTVFESFTQSDSGITHQYGGSGLGLTITCRLAEMMGGNVDLESEPGMGSVFSVTLPTNIEGASPEMFDVYEKLRSRESYDYSSLQLCGNILVAEDNAVNQKIIQRMLEKIGLKVDVVVDGCKAVEKALSKDYQLILMDVHMPNMDGIEATRRLRDEHYTGPIIVLSASVMEYEIRRYIDAGCDSCLAKPIDRAKLFRMLEHYLDCTQPEEAAEITKQVQQVQQVQQQIDELTLLVAKKPTSSNPTAPVVWQDIMGRLDDKDICLELIYSYLESGPKAVERLRQAVQSKEVESVRDSAHSVKGAAANIGAITLAKAAWQLELAGKEGRVVDFEGLLDTVKAEHETLVLYIEETDWEQLARES